MIFDCFPFFNEFDALEIRLHELSGLVDYFVLGESPTTFTGKQKPLLQPHLLDRFAAFRHQIIYCVMPRAKPGNAMGADTAQKRWLLQRLAGMAKPSDYVIVADADEVASRVGLQKAIGLSRPIVGLELWNLYYKLNCVRPGWISHPKLARYERIVEAGHDPVALRNAGGPKVAPAGWHFSFMTDIAAKIDAWGHQEKNRPPFNTPEHIAECVETGKDLFQRPGRDGRFVEDISFLPAYVRENPERFGHLLHGSCVC